MPRLFPSPRAYSASTAAFASLSISTGIRRRFSISSSRGNPSHPGRLGGWCKRPDGSSSGPGKGRGTDDAARQVADDRIDARATADSNAVEVGTTSSNTRFAQAGPSHRAGCPRTARESEWYRFHLCVPHDMIRDGVSMMVHGESCAHFMRTVNKEKSMRTLKDTGAGKRI